mmetsp:Transcript_14325/g.24867  ORF Transcript_14325/g.24867 Transcript_14325/m.24867 type:complete len:436 (-) Transcript_14325:167-1474(-)
MAKGPRVLSFLLAVLVAAGALEEPTCHLEVQRTRRPRPERKHKKALHLWSEGETAEVDSEDLVTSPPPVRKVSGEDSTFAVTTRVYRAELPYLEPFLKHYLQDIQADRVYLFCTNTTEEPLIRHTVKRFGFSPAQVKFLGALDPQKLQKLNYAAVSEDWIIDVDVDEFLRPPEGSLTKLVMTEPEADIFQLQWLCYPSDTTQAVAHAKPLPCVGMKGMIRASAFQPDERGVYPVRGGQPQCSSDCKIGKTRFVLEHLQYRGFYDALLRDISSPAGSQWMLKGQPKDIAFKKLRQGEPGNRLKSLAFEMACLEIHGRDLMKGHEDVYGSNSSTRHLHINMPWQSQLLTESGVDSELGEIAVNAYQQYKDALKASFSNLLCEPADACNVRPLHVTDLLTNMTTDDLKSYQDGCHRGNALELADKKSKVIMHKHRKTS